MTGLLQGRVALITGGGGGIGAGVARLFAAQGAKVIVNDLGATVDGSGSDAALVSGVVEEIRAAGGEAEANNGDVSDFESAGAMVRQAIDTYGKLDVLVNVAGILRDRMIFNMDEADWDAVVRVHLKGTYNTVRHASAYFRSLKNPDGNFRIINFTSGSGLHGAPGQPNYAAAKMGITGLTYSCANALWKYGVTVNAVNPSASTRMTDSIPGGWERGADVRSPDNIAPTVAYLASERASWCTGQVLYSSGYDIGLYNVPSVIRMVSSTGPWDLDNAARLIEASFPGAITPNVAPGITQEQLRAEPVRTQAT